MHLHLIPVSLPMYVQLVNSLGLGLESVRAGLHMWHYRRSLLLGQ
jgi:hypothetical protein